MLLVDQVSQGMQNRETLLLEIHRKREGENVKNHSEQKI